MRIRLALAGLTALVLCAGDRLPAQGTLSTQGLGYPPGQLSTAAASVGGATGESDPLSPLNPAALTFLNASIVAMQAAPEFRRINAGSSSGTSSVTRFPLFLGALKFGQRWAASISASTLLDRTWTTTTRDSQVITVGDTVREVRTQHSEGSITDIRLAAGYMLAPWLRVGVGAHAFSGRDFLRFARTFDDTIRFAPDTQQYSVGFGGNAISLGVQGLWLRKAAVGVSYRHGGTMRAYLADAVIGKARAPAHFGITAAYLGFQGATIAARAAKDMWSDMDGVEGAGTPHEGWDIGVGADVTGPRLGDTPVALRAGFRSRTLPFSPTADAVKERTVSGGFAFPMARNRVELNFGVLRASRDGVPGISESAWTINTGFSVKP